MSHPDPTHALVLAGGGAYGAYEVGVVRALLEGLSPSTGYMPCAPRIIAGSSAGAFNAALLVSGADRGLEAAVDHLERAWLTDVANDASTCGNGVFRFRLDAARFVDPGCLAANPAQPFVEFAEDALFLANDLTRRGVNLFTSTGSMEQRMLELVDVSTFLSTDPFERVIRRDISSASIRGSDRILQVATANWRTGALRMFGNEDFTDENASRIVRAATAIPGLFPSIDIGNEPYSDASFILNAPLRQPIDAGATVLHVVYFNPDVDTVPLSRLRNTVSTLNRALLISLGAMLNRDIELASRVNLALDLIQHHAEATSSKEKSAVVYETGSREAARAVRSVPHHPVEIHRYHASEPYGRTFQWLGFDREHIESLIAHGFEDTTRHDCGASGCVMSN